MTDVFCFDVSLVFTLLSYIKEKRNRLIYRIIPVTMALLGFSCSCSSQIDTITVREIHEPVIANSSNLATIEYRFADSDILLYPGYIDSSDSLIVIGLWGDSTTGGLSCFSWDGLQKWSIESGDYGYAAGICIHNDSVYYSVIEEISVLDAETGEFLASICVENLSDSLMLPEAPGEFMPAIKATQVMELIDDTLLWTLFEYSQRASYCGFITDRNFSYQRYLRIKKIEGQWYIGMTEGHFERLSLFEVPTINYSLRPYISNIILTDSSIIAALSYRDLVMEFDYNGQHIRSTHFGHQLSGPAQFTCTFPVSSSSRFLLSDLDKDEIGNIYLLYSGYGLDQNGKAEIWRVNTSTGEARMTQLNHSASAFTVYGDRVAVVEQTYEPGENEEVILLGTPSIHLYRIDWDV